jgi:hypothetical protein
MPASLPERYLLLGLRLGRHVDGLVDGYFGPKELQETVDAEDPVDPNLLLDEARALSGEVASWNGDPQRTRWLSAQLEGLTCVAEMLGGAEPPWLEAVRRCYGIDVEPVPEERFAAAHAKLDAALPGSGDVAARLQAWYRSQEIPADDVLPAFDALRAELQRRTAGLVDLPEGERLETELVTGKPWAAYNWYLGGLKSRIEVNTDLPMRSFSLAGLVAHEVYPGHHTEHACKEARLVRDLERIEASILLIHTPECLVSEGIAQVALERALGEDWVDPVDEILRPLRVPFDAATTRAVLDAHEDLGFVSVNVAYFASERGWTTDGAVDYFRQWALAEEDRARKSAEFATHPMWSAYVPTYSYGHRIVREYANRNEDAFRRLLTEQLTTADLLEPAAAV